MAASICSDHEKLCKVRQSLLDSSDSESVIALQLICISDYQVLTYLRIAHEHAIRGDFDWLLAMNEDQYVNQTKVLAALKQFDPGQCGSQRSTGANCWCADEVAVYARSPCGMHWKYSDQSHGNTLPR